MLCRLISSLACIGFVAAAPIANVQRRSEAGPVISTNFPDPSIINVDNTWYSFATRTIGSSIHIQVAKSTDFDSWAIVTNPDGDQYDALPNLPEWVNATSWNTWAPDVNQLPDGNFIMYYAATATANPAGTQHCIGAATSSSVLGPYTAQSSSLICPLSEGGAIDPDGYVDPSTGKRYIVYKIDGNSINGPTPLLLQEVTSDGYTFVGDPITLLNNDGASDDNIIEAPTLAKFESGTYVLFFSPGVFTTSAYSVSYATASAVTGPYTRQSTPLFATGTDGLTAPGSCDIWTDASHMVFHADCAAGRCLYTATLSIDGNTLSA